MTETTRIPVFVPGAGYEVLVGEGLRARVGDAVRTVTPASRVALVTDDHVSALFGQAVRDSLAEAGFDVVEIAVPAGEQSKSWTVAGEVLEKLAAARIDRTDVLVALGGGVIGDLAGFCAATYLRGIDFVQVPTTLLAQVDSSVGGKTGVDLVAGKNLAGAFKQPKLVLADTATLATLSDTEWRSGLAEVAKVAMLSGPGLLGWMEEHASALVSRETEAVHEAVAAAIGHKADVVVADEHETGLRESLNYGHTLGHAIERVSGYGAVPHGIAVAEGMRFAARIAARVLDAPSQTAMRQDALLDSLDIARAVYPQDSGALLRAMHSDKKARGGVVRFALVPEPGVYLAMPVADEVIAEELDAWLGPVTGRG